MHLAATISEHPVVAHAVGECVGDIIERRGDSPDVLVLCISDRLIGATEDIAAASGALLHPEVMIGIPCNEMSVGQRTSIGNGGLGMLALWHTRPSSSSGQVAVEPQWQVRAAERVSSVRLSPDANPPVPPIQRPRTGSADSPNPPNRTGAANPPNPTNPPNRTGAALPTHPTHPADPVGMADLAGRSGTLLLFTDPLTLPVRTLAERVSALAPDLSVIVASPGCQRPRAGAALVLDGTVFGDGAVGVHIPSGFPHRMLNSFGFAPVGPRFAVNPPVATSTGGVTRISQLGGRPAKVELWSVIEGLAPSERAAVTSGLHVRWIAPNQTGPDVARFASVLGTDGESIAVAGDVPDDAISIQFHVRDRESLDSDLQLTVARNAEMVGGLFFVVDRPERSGSAPTPPLVPSTLADFEANRSTVDTIGTDAAIITEEASRGDFLGIRCGEVLLVDRGDVVSADRAVTILGLVD